MVLDMDNGGRRVKRFLIRKIVKFFASVIDASRQAEQMAEYVKNLPPPPPPPPPPKTALEIIADNGFNVQEITNHLDNENHVNPGEAHQIPDKLVGACEQKGRNDCYGVINDAVQGHCNNWNSAVCNFMTTTSTISTEMPEETTTKTYDVMVSVFFIGMIVLCCCCSAVAVILYCRKKNKQGAQSASTVEANPAVAQAAKKKGKSKGSKVKTVQSKRR